MGRFPWEEMVKVSVNIQLVRIGLVTSVDWEHGTTMDCITPAPTKYPLTQVGYKCACHFIKRAKNGAR